VSPGLGSKPGCNGQTYRRTDGRTDEPNYDSFRSFSLDFQIPLIFFVRTHNFASDVILLLRHQQNAAVNIDKMSKGTAMKHIFEF